MSAPVTRVGRDSRLLATLAEDLHPDQPPFYSAGSDRGHPDGWYWTPAGAERPRYLGRNVNFAERKLLELLRGRQDAA